MTITIVFYSSKVLKKKDECPIMVRLSEGKKKKYVSTGVSCKTNDWNDNKNRVYSTDANYTEKNEKITAKYDYYESRKKEYYAAYNGYDLEYIASDKPIITQYHDETGEETITNFYDLIQLKIEDYTEDGSQKNIRQLKNFLLANFGDNIPISSINQKWFNEFLMKLNDTKTVRQAKKLIERFNIVYNFGRENGHIPYGKKLKFNANKYKFKIDKRAITEMEISAIQLLWQCDYPLYESRLELNGENKYEHTFDFHNPINALTLFLCMYALQGVSPCDFANLRIRDLVLLTEKDKDFNMKDYITGEYNELDEEKFLNFMKTVKTLNYYHICKNRQKNGTLFEVDIHYDILYPLIKNYLCTKNGTLKDKDDFLFNILDKNKTYSKKQQNGRVSNVFFKLNKSLKSYLSVNLKSLDLRKKSYYTTRFTFLTVGYHIGVNAKHLAQMAGHSEKETRTYLESYNQKEMAKINSEIWHGKKE